MLVFPVLSLSYRLPQAQVGTAVCAGCEFHKCILNNAHQRSSQGECRFAHSSEDVATEHDREFAVKPLATHELLYQRPRTTIWTNNTDEERTNLLLVNSIRIDRVDSHRI